MKKNFKNGIAKLGRQRYEVLATRRDPRRGGRRVSRRRVVDGSRHQAEAAKRQLEAELEAEVAGLTPPSMTLGDYAQRWLEARSATLKPSTKAKYVTDLERHILPALGLIELHALRPRDVAQFLANDTGAPNSKKNRLALLRVMAKDALAEELVERDFCLRVRVKVPRVYTQTEPNLLSEAQLDAVLEHIPAYWQELACTLAYTGLRWGEVAALRWADVDLDGKLISVRRTNWKGHMGTPKTQAGCRTVPLAEPLAEILRARKGGSRSGRGLVFPTKKGTPHKGTPLSPVLHAACRAAGVPFRFTPHGLRRTWNNIGRRLASGMVVRSMIGHGSEAMTEHYSLVDETEKRATAEAIVARMRRPRSTPQPAGDASPAGQPRPVVDGTVDGRGPEHSGETMNPQ
ncbi:tyrosine-type recombinase/integrase [Haliangium sp.]|uniref:tyrosine-type recombinase/integrase n=1 Tax=Haliangium sp. TaxID=2663208 RepID=UPI003D0A40F6